MKGFIEIDAYNNATLININQIESVCEFPYGVEIYMIGKPQNPWIADDSYEDIVNKIKQAMEE